VYAVSRFQLVQQAKRDATLETVQAKPTAQKALGPLPMSQPISTASVPPTVPKQEPKPAPPVKKPLAPAGDDSFTNPKRTLPDEVTPPAKPVVVSEVEELIRLLSNKDEVARMKAAKELGRLKEKAKAAIPALKLATVDDDEDVREIAKKSLVAIQTALGEKPEAIKPASIRPDPVKVDAKLAPLIKDLRSKDNKVRLAAITKLDDLGLDAKPAEAALVEFGMMCPNTAIREAANAVMEKIDPLICKDIITVLYDKDAAKKNLALESLVLQGAKAKPALPIIRGYHDYLLNASGSGEVPANTTVAMVKIAPDTIAVQREVLKLVGLPIEKLTHFCPGVNANRVAAK